MLCSQVLSIFLRVLCKVVTHRKTIIGAAKADPTGRNVYRNAGEQPLLARGAKCVSIKSYIIVDFRITWTLLSVQLGNSSYRIFCSTNF